MPVADRVAAALAEQLGVRRRRVPLDEIWQHLFMLEPALRTDAGKRARLAELLDELAEQGLLELPRTRGSYEHSEKPPLPQWVLVGEQQISRSAASTETARTFPWRPELSFVASLARVSPEELSLLQRVNGFLRDGGPQSPVVPAQERSLQLFGDEKFLDRVSRGRLFSTGRLSLALLRCEYDPPPFVIAHVGDGDVLLVVENGATFRTLRRLLNHDTPVGVLAYGGGLAFIQAVGSALDLVQRVGRIVYYGDLDPTGLHIPIEAGERAAELGLPAIEPASDLYRLLIEHGHDAAGPESCSAGRAEQLAGWLADEELASHAAALLARRRRLAQEWTGYELLARNRQLLLGL